MMPARTKSGEHVFFSRCCHVSYACAPFLGRMGRKILDDKETGRALSALELDIKTEEVHAFSLLAFAASFAFVFILLLASFLAGFSITLFFVFFVIVPFILYLYIEKYPLMLLESRKAEVLGHVPALASYLVISLRISPVLEKAVEFTAGHVGGFPGRLLCRMISDIRLGRGSSMVESLSAFACEWGNISEFRSFMQLTIASTLEASEKNRWLMLDGGMNVLLSGLKERTGNAARNLETPILTIFTFLVILPLVFIGLVPVIPTIGVDVSPPVIFLLYDVALPTVLFIAISFVASSKPVTIPPVELPAEEQDMLFMSRVKSRTTKYVFHALIFIIALFIALPGYLDLSAALDGREQRYPLGSSLILIGAAAGMGIYFLSASYGVKKLRDGIMDDENEFTETLRQLSVLLSSGRPLPNAMAHLGDINKGGTAGIFTKASSNIRLFNMDLREAFFNPRAGSAARVYSEMMRSSIETLIAMSDRSSKSIASVLIRLSEHIRNMRSVDVEMKKIIGNVTSSMVLIAVFVGPLVGGVATSLGYLIATTLGAEDYAGMGFGDIMIKTVNPEIVKLIIGVYVLETTAVLTYFSDELVYGRDPVIKKYHLGIYLPVAALIYTLTIYVIQEILSKLI